MDIRKVFCLTGIIGVLAVNSISISASASEPPLTGEDEQETLTESTIEATENNADIVLSIPDIELNAGETIEIPVKLEKHTKDITSFEIVLSSNVLTFDANAGIGGFLADNESSNDFVCRFNEHELIIVWGSGYGTSPDHLNYSTYTYSKDELDPLEQFFTFSVTASDTAYLSKTSEISVKKCVFNEDTSLDVDFQNGQISIEKSDFPQNVITTAPLPVKQEKKEESILPTIIFLIVCLGIGGFTISATIAHINRLGAFDPEAQKNNFSDGNLNGSIRKARDNVKQLKSQTEKLENIVNQIIQK